MKENNFETIHLPRVKKIWPKLFCDDIQPLSAEECAKIIKEMFDDFEAKTGYKVVVNIQSDSSPIGGLFSSENIIKTDKT